MELLFNILKVYGIHVNENTDTIVLFLCVILILNTIVLIGIIQILIFVFVRHILIDDSKLDSFINVFPIIIGNLINKIVKMYKQISIIYIFYDSLLVLLLLCSCIWLILRVVYHIL